MIKLMEIPSADRENRKISYHQQEDHSINVPQEARQVVDKQAIKQHTIPKMEFVDRNP